MFSRTLAVLTLTAILMIQAEAGATSSRNGREDPTQPEQWLATPTQINSDLPTLSSVLIGPDRKLAVIDGRLMAEGEQRQGLKLWKVEADRVVVSQAGANRITLYLNKANVIKETR